LPTPEVKEFQARGWRCRLGPNGWLTADMSIPGFLGPAARRTSGRFQLVHVESGAVLASRAIIGGGRSRAPASLAGGRQDDVVRVVAGARWINTWSSRAPLDAAFVGADGTILEIRPGLKPRRVAVSVRAHAVIEAPDGFFERNDLQAGDRVAIREAQAARPARDLIAPPRELETVPPGIQELDADSDPWDVGSAEAVVAPAAAPAPPPPPVAVGPAAKVPAAPRDAPAAAVPAPAVRPKPRRPPSRGAALSQVLARETPIEWFEAVAIVQGLCSVLLEDPPPGGRHVPETEDIAILPEGAVELLAEGPADAPVVRVARLLHSLAEGTAFPVQLRLLVLQELSPTPGCKSVLEFSTRLALYERPGRANMIRAVYERFTRLPPREAEAAAAAPAAPAARPPVEREPWWRRRATLVAGGAVVSFVVLYALGAWLWGIVAPPPTGAPDTRGSVARALGDAGASVAEAATESARTVSRWFGVRPEPAPASEPAVEPVEVVLQPSGAAPRRPRPRTAAPGPAAAPTEAPEEPRPVSADPSIFTAANADVVPPALVRARLPSSPPPGVSPEDLPEVEVVVSPQGQVESVKLVTPDAGVLPSMMLSAIKNWKFDPATRNGEAVRYRLRMRLTNQRPG
jgi:hypothetical protein